ncbi:hypothetical protein E4Z66_02710 [Aliishimia ponticola]|uniref:Uncharacterized protein n=1 Tax=Aliishimia ponticola TaxID=2499833 RepID=A0A4S4NFZ8_9RHOB|nr:hypothetical protein [Aliishimia ponticola]THH38499.1 hypothetical protein E4Z66_02710 [Aliishimia ponticola]
MHRPALLALTFAVILPVAVWADIPGARKRARSGDFDATAQIRCAQDAGKPLVRCPAQITRTGNAAVLRVTFPSGFARYLVFSEGAFLRGNATMSGVGTDTDWALSGGIYTIRVDDQRFEIDKTQIWGE